MSTLDSKIPEGPIKTDDKKITVPSRVNMKQSMESLIHHMECLIRVIFNTWS